jgi:hypothetical protein
LHPETSRVAPHFIHERLVTLDVTFSGLKTQLLGKTLDFGNPLSETRLRGEQIDLGGNGLRFCWSRQ